MAKKKARPEKVILYKGKNGEVELRADGERETVWATQEEICKLFDVSRPNITMHLANIFETEELIKDSVCKESLHTAKDGKQYNVIFYNLDAIIAVGYRVNSKSATQFRIWVTKILRDYIINGYSLNAHKLHADSDRMEDVYDALDYIESPELKGKLKGKITLRITKELI